MALRNEPHEMGDRRACLPIYNVHRQRYDGECPAFNPRGGIEIAVLRGFHLQLRSKTRRLMASLCSLVVAFACAVDLTAQIPLSQMYHRSWTARDGAPSNVAPK